LDAKWVGKVRLLKNGLVGNSGKRKGGEGGWKRGVEGGGAKAELLDGEERNFFFVGFSEDIFEKISRGTASQSEPVT